MSRGMPYCSQDEGHGLLVIVLSFCYCSKVRDTIKDMGRSLVEQTRSYMIASCIGGTQLSSALQSVMHR